ncbi:MAG: D-alanyl-D-alanine carboxypeptidase family protein [Pseudomonadota bacterium]
MKSFSQQFWAPCAVSFGMLVTVLAGPLPAMAQAADTVIETAAREAIVLDFTSGRVLLDKNADQRMPTASMSKLATMFMVFEALENGRLQLDQELPVSEKAWRKGGSKMFVDVGSQVAVSDLMRGVIIQSGNDATIVLAEALAGTEDAFADAMTRRMQQLGMTNSQFRNASGWPNPEHYSTARDLSLLARMMIERFPQHYSIYSEREFTYNDIKQGNRNPLLYRGVGADGLKTGHTEEAGYGLVASAIRDNRRIILVINGLPSVQARADESAKLLEWAFANFQTYKISEPGSVLHEAPVWLGDAAQVPLILEDEVYMTVSWEEASKFDVFVEVDQPIPAPISQGQVLGHLVVNTPASTERYPLIAGADVEQRDFMGRVEAAVSHLVFGSQE